MSTLLTHSVYSEPCRTVPYRPAASRSTQSSDVSGEFGALLEVPAWRERESSAKGRSNNGKFGQGATNNNVHQLPKRDFAAHVEAPHLTTITTYKSITIGKEGRVPSLPHLNLNLCHHKNHLDICHV